MSNGDINYSHGYTSRREEPIGMYEFVDASEIFEQKTQVNWGTHIEFDAQTG